MLRRGGIGGVYLGTHRGGNFGARGVLSGEQAVKVGSRYLIVAALMTAFALLISGVAGATAFRGYNAQLTRAPYLTDLTQSSVQVTWATKAQYTGVVQYGPSGSCTAHAAIATKMGNPITVGATKEYQNTVVVSGLSPATTYCYRVTNTGASPVDLLGSNASPHFKTLQSASGTQPFTFDVLGDWGDTTNSGSNTGSLNVNQAGVDAGIAASGAQFALSVGDIAYQGGTQTNYGDLNQTGVNVSAVFNRNYWAVPGQSTPLFQTDGNHGQNATSLNIWPESLSAQTSGGSYQMGSYPSIDGSRPASYPDTYYAFSTGGVRFYMLDAAWAESNVGTARGGACGSICRIYQLDHDAHWTVTSAEYQWLQRDLAAHPGGLKFAFFHFPLYTANATQTTDAYLDKTPGSTNSLEQLLHDNGVQLTFSGHAHIYERNSAVPGGVTNYVTGGGGGMVEPVSRCSSNVAYAIGWSYSHANGSACGAAPKPLSDSQVFHFLKVSVNGSTVTVAPTNAQGQAFDVMTYNFGADSAQPSAPGLTGQPSGVNRPSKSLTNRSTGKRCVKKGRTTTCYRYRRGHITSRCILTSRGKRTCTYFKKTGRPYKVCVRKHRHSRIHCRTVASLNSPRRASLRHLDLGSGDQAAFSSQLGAPASTATMTLRRRASTEESSRPSRARCSRATGPQPQRSYDLVRLFARDL